MMLPVLLPVAHMQVHASQMQAPHLPVMMLPVLGAVAHIQVHASQMQALHLPGVLPVLLRVAHM